MESLLAIQNDIKEKISKAQTNFKKSPKERITAPYVEIRLEQLEQHWSLFSSTHTKLISTVDTSEFQKSNYYKDGMYDEVEEVYIVYKTNLRQVLFQLARSNDSVNRSESNNGNASCPTTQVKVRLPELKIPSFSGKYTEWPTFRDLFLGLVHKNVSLDDAQKFFYLKGHLTGEAEQLLRHIQVTSDNYKSSWEKLESMYNNKKYLANGILNRLLNQKSLSSESAIEIKQLVSTTSDCLESIKNLGIDVSSWDILIIHIISLKLDKDTRKAWELKNSSDTSDELPTFAQFTEFLTGRFRGLENLEDTRTSKPTHGDKGTKRTASFHLNDSKPIRCEYCSENHRLSFCTKFKKQSIETRRDFAKEKGLCFRCLGCNHSAKICKYNIRCKICKGRHNSLLHPGVGSGFNIAGPNGNIEERSSSLVDTVQNNDVKNTKTTSAACATQSNDLSQPLVSCASTSSSRRTILLATAVVNAKSKDGDFKLVRSLLDQGSQGSFVTEATAQYLGLRKFSSDLRITGVGGNKNIRSKYFVTLKIRSRVDPYCEVEIKAHVLKSITALLPCTNLAKVEWLNVINLELADPDYYKPNKIDVLLGADVYSQVLKEGLKRSPDGSMVAQDTCLGWILSGVIDTEGHSNTMTHISVMHAAFETDDILKKFWELEAEPVTKKMFSEEEMKCEELFTSTTKRDSSGRYIVRLPFRNADPQSKYGDSRTIALRRLKNLESKLANNKELKEQYTNVIHEYLELGHMKKVPKENERNKEAVYLPHHAVVRDQKETTKVRIVFDASCKGKNGVSLNDDLMIGPQLQGELRHLIMRWRMHTITVVADIVQMYRQVLVDRRDTVYQRILWRDQPDKDVEEYELITVTFGIASSPYLAVRALQQVANDEAVQDSIASKIKNDYYIDDLMTGAENIDDCYDIYSSMSAVLSKAGFKLQKWSSNSEELLDKIRETKLEQGEELKIKTDDTVKILGLTWLPRTDAFQYSVNMPPLLEPATKRKVISDISRLFDPLGWLAPSIILAKILIQKLWLAGINWDDKVPDNLLTEWLTYRNALPSLKNIKIPRWVNTHSSNKGIELHGFSDASKLAYAAVVYVRIIDSEENIKVFLVASRTKVAPIKQISIPKLELSGALLLAKLLLEVSEAMRIPASDIRAWTDSEVVLAWLNSHPSRWKTFVANRVTEILLTLDTHHWAHVSTKENPADCASRGILPSELEKHDLWFNGPGFLKNPMIEYKKTSKTTNLEEVKSFTTVVDCSIWNKYSSLTRLIRVISYCRRFLKLLGKNKDDSKSTYLSKTEIDEAMQICIKRSQEEGFMKERDALISNNFNPRDKTIKSLNLFLDSEGVIRVGGRLQMSDLDYNRKHPILIPKESFLTRLLVQDAHEKTFHGGPQLMINYLRMKFWILGVKYLVKACLRNCVKCIRYSAKTRPQLMGQVPAPRLTSNLKAFQNSGLDFAGPINIRVSKGRGNKSYKGYIALFICMATRAVHLEVVSDLTSKAFLAAFKRFVARRGRCTDLYSDNGTNFVGASRELQNLFEDELSGLLSEISESLANNYTNWHFIPPHAPNFGGLWEAGIKSTKYHLKRVIGNSTLTFEEMSTVLSQIEACLNSRPMSYVEDPNERVVLTPGHFLVGEPLVLPPDSNYEQSNIQTLRRWQLTQRMVQDFWRHWSQDYLNQFLQRNKWRNYNPEPTVGDMVLVKEDGMPPSRWLLGKVEQKHPGPDAITRVVTIRTQNNVIKRPTSKIIVLPATA